jgi:hypothetical protein
MAHAAAAASTGTLTRAAIRDLRTSGLRNASVTFQ